MNTYKSAIDFAFVFLRLFRKESGRKVWPDQSLDKNEYLLMFPPDSPFRVLVRAPGTPLPTGYYKHVDRSPDNEYMIMFPAESPFNVLPANPPNYRFSSQFSQGIRQQLKLAFHDDDSASSDNRNQHWKF
ncbi:hypothetical protein CTI12_AA061500 [Artemisia annua]|uniref:Uncharacterized protein n=1 Tax=Artemisia annua TaxID=35608 RepID=A0A2U1Q8W4_ARTAN|nr:hypothetical protein CTI12_AA061500 [Artemisia annua]